MVLTIVLLALCTLAIEDDFHDVREALERFNKSKWNVLGKELGLQTHLLDVIRVNSQPYDVEECFDRVLEAWLKCSHDKARFKPPTWHRLAKAVEKSGDRARAEKILAQYSKVQLK